MRNPTLILTVALATFVVSGPRAGGQDAPPSAKDKAARLIAVLRSDAGLYEKQEACRDLAIVGDKEAVPVLAGLLADEKLSHMARYALEPMPDPAAGDALRDALGKLKGKLLIGVINSVGMRRDAQAVAALIRLLKDADGDVAAAAAAALGRIASPEAVETLSRLRASAPEPLQAVAADASLAAAEQLLRAARAEDAARIYEDLEAPNWPKHVRVGAFAGLLAARPDEAVSRAFKALTGDDPVLRAVAIANVASLKGANVAERFAAQMPSLPPDVQVLLINALAGRGEAAARPAIVSAAGSANDEVRLAALGALGMVGDADCVEMLCKAVAGGAGDAEKRAAAGSLRTLRAEGVDAAIIRYVQAAPSGAQAELLDVLADRKADAAPVLLAQARAGDAKVRAAAFRALGRLAGPKDLPALLQLLGSLTGDDGRDEAERALVLVSRKVPDEASQADAALTALKAATDAPARCSFLRVLGGIGNAKAFEAVQLAAGDKDPAVRDAAVRALVDWPDARALDALLALFRTTDNQVHRVLALRGCARLLGLGSLSAADTLRAYEELMQQARRPEDRKLVLAGLGNVADPAALKMVEPLLADAAVRTEAELAALSIAGGIVAFAPEEAKAVAKRLQAESKDTRVRRGAAQIVRQLGELEDYVAAWQVCGPFAEQGKSGSQLFEVALPPEKADAKGLAWQPLRPGGRSQSWMMDLSNALGGEQRVAYARTWVHCDKDQPARLEFGTDDGNKVWLNGKLVHAANQGGAATPGKYKADITLRKGWNALMLKVVQDTGPWEFCLRIADRSGGAIQGLRVQPTPPAE